MSCHLISPIVTWSIVIFLVVRCKTVFSCTSSHLKWLLPIFKAEPYWKICVKCKLHTLNLLLLFNIATMCTIIIMCSRVDSFGVIMSQNNLPPDAKQGKSITWMITPKTTQRQPRASVSALLRILAGYQACHETYQLKLSSMTLILADQSQDCIQHPVFWLVVELQVHGGNLKSIRRMAIHYPARVLTGVRYRPCLPLCVAYVVFSSSSSLWS